MKKKLQVHALPIDEDVDTSKLPCLWSNNIVKAYHIYFTSDKEIKEVKEGRIYLWDDMEVKKASKSFRLSDYNFKWAKEVVATTNPDIQLGNRVVNGVAVSEYLQIAKISQSFIETFVKAQGKITEVMVEYENKRIRGRLGEGDYLCSSITGDELRIEQLKLNSDGTVIWSLVENTETPQEAFDRGFTAGYNAAAPKEKMYTRYEFKKAIRDTLWGAKGHSPMSEQDYTDFDKWFNKTYPL
jgi:hypothetical protein